MTEDAGRWDHAYRQDVPPPWDIGRPQQAFELLAETGRLAGRVLDCGCGTGEHALLAAAHGADVVGIDLSPQAIATARRKAAERKLTARFAVADALRLEAPRTGFDVVIDSGVFHSFDDDDRARYVDSLRRQLRIGGTCYLMCFSDRQPGDWGPRRVREAELGEAFAGHWAVQTRPSTFTINAVDGITEVYAWFAELRRES